MQWEYSWNLLENATSFLEALSRCISGARASFFLFFFSFLLLPSFLFLFYKTVATCWTKSDYLLKFAEVRVGRKFVCGRSRRSSTKVSIATLDATGANTACRVVMQPHFQRCAADAEGTKWRYPLFQREGTRSRVGLQRCNVLTSTFIFLFCLCPYLQDQHRLKAPRRWFIRQVRLWKLPEIRLFIQEFSCWRRIHQFLFALREPAVKNGSLLLDAMAMARWIIEICSSPPYCFTEVPPITYYWTGLLILDHSYLVRNLTNSKVAETKEPLQSWHFCISNFRTY